MKLLISENNQAKFKIWEDAFQNISSVEVLLVSPSELKKLPLLDAIILPGILVHEEYGGKPEVNKSQIISTEDFRDMPKWVITTPPIKQDGFWKKKYKGKNELEWVATSELDENDVTQFSFNKVFDNIHQFNISNGNPISTIGFSPILVLVRSDPKEDSLLIREAYLNFLLKAE